MTVIVSNDADARLWAMTKAQLVRECKRLRDKLAHKEQIIQKLTAEQREAAAHVRDR